MNELIMSDVVSLYLEVLRYCLPFIVFFGLGNMIVNMILSSAFGGKLRMGGVK